MINSEKEIKEMIDRILKDLKHLTDLSKGQSETSEEIVATISSISIKIGEIESSINNYKKELQKNYLLTISNFNALQYISPSPFPYISDIPPYLQEEFFYMYYKLFKKLDKDEYYQKKWRKRMDEDYFRKKKLFELYNDTKELFERFLVHHRYELFDNFRNILNDLEDNLSKNKINKKDNKKDQKK